MPEITGTKWGASRLGSDGGVVTYSLIGGDVAGFFGDNESRSTDPEAFTDFGVRALLRRAFTEWSDVANIEFVEVKEQGEAASYGYASDIRIVFGEIDGPGGFLATARLPIEVALPTEGDIFVDSGDLSLGRDRQKLLAVVTHEDIGVAGRQRSAVEPGVASQEQKEGDADADQAPFDGAEVAPGEDPEPEGQGEQDVRGLGPDRDSEEQPAEEYPALHERPHAGHEKGRVEGVVVIGVDVSGDDPLS